MLGRIKSLSKRNVAEEESEVPFPDQASVSEHIETRRSYVYGDSPQASGDPPGADPAPSPENTATMMMGGSGVSLDGRSLVVPMDRDREFDEVSSINTREYTYVNEMRIVGEAGQERDVETSNYEGPIAGKQIPKGDSYEYHNARPKRDEKTMDSGETYEGGCLPLWITDAPRWLKIVIVLSTALLVGAIVLIGVGATIAVQKNNSEAATQTNPSGPAFPSLPNQPVSPPTGGNGGGNSPVASPTTDNSPTSPTGGSDGSTAAPVASPTRPTITVPGTPQPTVSTTASPTSSTVTFFVTGGRFTGEALNELPQQLNTLPQDDGNTVMFHLGDWNSPFATECVEESYQTNVDLFSNSTVPVYFVPGDNEYNDCPDPEQAFQFWEQYMMGYETQFWSEPTAWNITRQEPAYAENFAYVFNGVLFVGINLVGGVVHDNREWQERHQANLRWIDEQYYLNEGDFDVMVVLAHADPDIQANNDFFETFYERVQFNYNLQVLFVHRNLGVESWALEPQFNGIDNLMVVVVEGSIWPPMMMQVDTKAGTVDIDQGQWYEDYIALSGGNP